MRIMARPIVPLDVDEDQRKALHQIVRATTSPQRAVIRAKLILDCADGFSQEEAARRVGVQRKIANKWCRRFRKQGLAGLDDAKGRGRRPGIDDRTRERVITEATRPPRERIRWSVRSMARHVGVSVGSVHSLWQANDIKPHLSRTFKLSKDPDFEPKFWDVIGLYLDPPQKALVLCCDEKNQCQALERTQPGLPLGIGHIRTRTHDYIRHGTITLFAALNSLDGKIISRTAERHTHLEWLAFLKQLDKEAPKKLDLHLIIDNYATHKHPEVKKWLAAHPRFHLHFTPTSSSWMNLVERFFRDLSEEVVREGSFTAVRELQNAIERYLAERNLAPKRYVWKAKGAEILGKIRKARLKMESNLL
jgi:transposase